MKRAAHSRNARTANQRESRNAVFFFFFFTRARVRKEENARKKHLSIFSLSSEIQNSFFLTLTHERFFSRKSLFHTLKKRRRDAPFQKARDQCDRARESTKWGGGRGRGGGTFFFRFAIRARERTERARFVPDSRDANLKRSKKTTKKKT